MNAGWRAVATAKALSLLTALSLAGHNPQAPVLPRMVPPEGQVPCEGPIDMAGMGVSAAATDPVNVPPHVPSPSPPGSPGPWETGRTMPDPGCSSSRSEPPTTRAAER